MEINSKAWNPSMHNTMRLDRHFDPNCYREPVNAADYAIDLTITALRTEGCNPDVATTITLPLDEYRLLISDAQKKAKEEGCKEGRKEAWDLAQRINLLPLVKEGAYVIDDLGEAFGTCDWSKVMLMPVEEALKKDKAYQEDKNTLHVGDEVEFTACGTTRKGYVINVVSPVLVRVLTKDLGTYPEAAEKCKKTGKHSDEIVKAMASFEKGEC